ncbi:glycosyltransferase [Paenibacillus agri]|uniref:Glycosyltransferase n=1 Tax=Paenibacillus agri TaxID=2744309 RepID=A0A850EMH5_9BACL|nr:glycosyltransferase family A protein [Paenibacillus agri]NUU59762.1 glycosyltransferase [Paenibacillus agri]
MIQFLQLLMAILVFQGIFAVWNISRFPKLGVTTRNIRSRQRSNYKAQGLELSILIPARDEATNIGPCLESVLNCGLPPDTEILVLDDSSTDGTADVARDAGQGRVRVLAGQPLPSGWLGKSHACAQLAEAARGEWLLFLDADIRLRPGALMAALTTARGQGCGLITGFPRQTTVSWLERLIVPLMNFTILCHLPLPLVRGSGDPRFVAAHGGFMLIHRETYGDAGGHAGIRTELVDDMALARAVKRSGNPVTLTDITDYTDMRMYHNAREVWNGYRKNIYDGLGRRPLLLLAILVFYILLYVMPPVMLVFAIAEGCGTAMLWSAGGMMTGMAIKRVSDGSGKQPSWLCLLMPVSILCLVGISIASWRGSLPGRGYEWKGRRYP